MTPGSASGVPSAVGAGGECEGKGVRAKSPLAATLGHHRGVSNSGSGSLFSRFILLQSPDRTGQSTEGPAPRAVSPPHSDSEPSKVTDPTGVPRSPGRPATALRGSAGSAGPMCVRRAWPGYVHRSPACSRELRAHGEGRGAPRAVPPAGPAGEPPRTAAARRPQAPPGRWRPRPEADVRKGTRPPRPRGAARRWAWRPAPTSRPLAGTQQGGPGPAGHWPRDPRICIRAGGGARAGAGCGEVGGPCGAGRGRRGSAAAAEFGLRAGDGPAPRLQVTREGSQTGGRGLGPGWCGGARTHKLEGKEGSGVGRPFCAPGGPSRRRAATAHRTLRCSGPTVRVTAADLSLGSATTPALL